VLVLKHTPHAHRHFMLLPVCPTASCSILLPWLCVQLLITYTLYSSPPLPRIDHEMAPSTLEDGSAPGAGPPYDLFETLPRFRPEPEHSPVDIECLPVTRGEVVPSRELLQHYVAQLSFIHGIRHHEDYANLPQVVDLCQDVEVPKSAAFTRARHSRQIMSNIIPDIPRAGAVLPAE